MVWLSLTLLGSNGNFLNMSVAKNSANSQEKLEMNAVSCKGYATNYIVACNVVH